ncbi:MAG: phosphatidate cytidylyltransferase [Candidatus Firestonebacteria bacterium]
MLKRIIVAILFIPLFTVTIFLENPIFYYCLVSIFLLLGLLEYHSMIKKANIETFGWLNVLLFITVLYGMLKFRIFNFNNLILYGFLTTLVVYSILIAIFSLFKRDVESSTMSIVFTIFGAFYLIILGSSLILLRNLGVGKTFFLFLTVWIYDSGAYFIGSAFGQRKIMPIISPNKSLEGLIGGVVISLIIVTFLKYVTSIIPFDSLPYAFFVVIVVCLSAQVGDLLESLLKRFCGVKDSSNIISGHGGILDKLDSFLLATPVYLLLSTI